MDPDEAVITAEIDRARTPLGKKHAKIHPLRTALMDAMWEDVGVIRSGESIERGIARVADIGESLREFGVAGEDLAFNLTWHDWLNLKSLVEVSEVIARAALSRENSRGAHFRDDFPESGDLESSYFTVARQSAGAVTVDRQPVAFTIVKPGETLLRDDEAESLVKVTR